MRERNELNTMLAEQIAFFGREAGKHKNLYRNSRYTVSALGALSAILAALTFMWDEKIINLSIVIVSAVSGFIAFREGLRKPYELWMNERTTSHALLDLQREIRFELHENSAVQEVRDYFLRMQNIVITSGKNWKSMVTTHNNTVSQEGQN